MEDAEFLRFGKYKGDSVYNLIDDDPGYLEWLLEQDWLRDDLRAEVEKAFAQRDVSMIRFGKWEGHTVDEVAVEDRGYLRWMLEQDWIKDDMKEYIEGVLYG